MKKTLYFLLAVALAACNKDNNPGGNTNTTADEPCELTLKISSTDTRGMTGEVDGTDYENAIKTLEFYVFDENGDPDVEVGRVDASTPGTGYKKITSSAKTHKITMAGGPNKKIVAVINMGLEAPETNTYEGLKKELAKWVYTASGTDHNARTENRTGGFEMTGEAMFSIDAGTVNNSITINVSRLSSRVNAPVFMSGETGFIELADDELETIWGEQAATVKTKPLTYVNKGWVLINGRAKSDIIFIGNDKGDGTGDDQKTKPITVGGENYVIPDWDEWNGDIARKAPLNSAFDTDGFYTNTYSGKGTAADWFLDGSIDGEHRVYVFENKPGTITVEGITGYDPVSTYAVIVKGTIVVDGDEDNTNSLNSDRYWRIDLTRENDYHVFRNTSYAITVNKLSTPGYGTPEEAEKSNPIIPGREQTALDVTISVSKWRLNRYTTPM